MKIKCGRREFEVTEKDRILDNGSVYILVTQKYFAGWYRQSPTVAKATFNKLLKDGRIRRTTETWKGIREFNLYAFVIKESEGK